MFHQSFSTLDWWRSLFIILINCDWFDFVSCVHLFDFIYDDGISYTVPSNMYSSFGFSLTFWSWTAVCHYCRREEAGSGKNESKQVLISLEEARHCDSQGIIRTQSVYQWQKDHRPAMAIWRERGRSMEKVETRGSRDISVGMIMYTYVTYRITLQFKQQNWIFENCPFKIHYIDIYTSPRGQACKQNMLSQGGN